MWVAGVQVPAGAVAELALLLERAGERGLAQRLGIAYDTNSGGAALYPGDRAAILAVLKDAPERLHELRDALAEAPATDWQRPA